VLDASENLETDPRRPAAGGFALSSCLPGPCSPSVTMFEAAASLRVTRSSCTRVTAKHDKSRDATRPAEPVVATLTPRSAAGPSLPTRRASSPCATLEKSDASRSAAIAAGASPSKVGLATNLPLHRRRRRAAAQSERHSPPAPIARNPEIEVTSRGWTSCVPSVSVTSSGTGTRTGRSAPCSISALPLLRSESCEADARARRTRPSPRSSAARRDADRGHAARSSLWMSPRSRDYEHWRRGWCLSDCAAARRRRRPVKGQSVAKPDLARAGAGGDRGAPLALGLLERRRRASSPCAKREDGPAALRGVKRRDDRLRRDEVASLNCHASR